MPYMKNVPKWVIFASAALVLLGIGSAVYSSGWSQGFLMGVLTGNMDGAIAPYVTSRTQGWHHGGFGGGFFGFFGFIFRVFFTLFLIGLFLKFIGFLRWRRHGWRNGWHGGGWQGGPWGGPGCGGQGVGPRGQSEGQYDERVEGHYGPQYGSPQAQGYGAHGPWDRPQPQPRPATPPAAPSTATGVTGENAPGESAASGGSDPEHKPQQTSWTQL